MDVKEENILGDYVAEHWYYKSKAKALQCYIGDRSYVNILDVGAGSGFFSKWLLRHTDAKQATCVDTGYTHQWDEEIKGKPIHFRNFCKSSNADLVLLMDVLEHVDDDVELLRQYVKIVPKGTTFIISVPSFKFLWSSHDIFLEHKRRYTINLLKKRILESKLEIKLVNYYFGLVLPIAVAVRLAEKARKNTDTGSRSTLKRHCAFVNSFLAGLCMLELPFMRMNKFAGLSVFCQCRKN